MIEPFLCDTAKLLQDRTMEFIHTQPLHHLWPALLRWAPVFLHTQSAG
jgi:hypothetical protein